MHALQKGDGASRWPSVCIFPSVWTFVLLVPLTLPDAVKLALEKNPSLEAATAQVRAAGSRVDQAKTAAGPRVSWMESFQTSNNPVFAFGSLLNQRRFAASNFAIDKLNSPGFVNNFQTVVNAEQSLYDGGAVKAQVRAAEAGRGMAEQQRRGTQMQTIAAVAGRYHTVWLAGEARKVAEAAVKSVEADLERAKAVRQAGMSTDADVLTIEVHLAEMRERVVNAVQDERVARASLNEAMGMPLDTELELTAPATGVAAAAPTAVAADRPDLKQAGLMREAAEAQGAAARAALYPQVALRGVFEADRGRFVTQAGANWFAGVTVRWNLFNGGADRRRIDETSHQVAAARAGERQLANAAALQLKQAEAAQTAAAERLAVAESAIASATESLRILKNRFGAGLATVQDLLRNETALLETQTRRLRALHDQRLAAIAVALAAGTLTGDSDVLR